MHRLLILSEQNQLQSPAISAPNASKGRDLSSKMSSSAKGKNSNESLLDSGLVAWWTFEDGPSASLVAEVRVEDITGKRFKTLVQRGNNKFAEDANYWKKKALKALENNESLSLKKAENIVEVTYERRHYNIPEDVLQSLSELMLSKPRRGGASACVSACVSPNQSRGVSAHDRNEGPPSTGKNKALLGSHPFDTDSPQPLNSRNPTSHGKSSHSRNGKMVAKSDSSAPDVFHHLYQVNRKVIAEVEAVVWLDADSLPQKATSHPKAKNPTSDGGDLDVSSATDSSLARAAVGSGANAIIAKSMLPLPSFRQRHQCPFEVILSPPTLSLLHLSPSLLL